VIAALDVHYLEQGGAAAAGVLFDRWEDAAPAATRVSRIARVAAYQSGEFYARELPCLLAVLERIPEPLACVVVDGYVWLAPGRPGLGARLYEALGARVPVVGVAKTPFRGAVAIEVLRGQSRRPLRVNAAGMRAEDAAERIRRMHGAHRIPTLLAAADRACRSA
jgi:deoxyribonuclease V